MQTNLLAALIGKTDPDSFWTAMDRMPAVGDPPTAASDILRAVFDSSGNDLDPAPAVWPDAHEILEALTRARGALSRLNLATKVADMRAARPQPVPEVAPDSATLVQLVERIKTLEDSLSAQGISLSVAEPPADPAPG